MKLRRAHQIGILLAVMLSLAAAARGLGAKPKDRGGAVPGEASLRAENKMLRATVERQKVQIAALRERVELLQARLEEAGVDVKDGAAARPAPAQEEAESAGANPAPPGRAARRAAPAKRVVFVVDASGSMINQFGRVTQQLKLALDELEPGQSFNIVAVQNNEAKIFRPRLQPASEANVKKAKAFLADVPVTGTGEMAVGLAAALSLRPDVVWFVTDGTFPDVDATVRDVKRRNATVKARINVAAMLDPGPPADYQPRGHLLKLASENNGVCVGPTGQPLDEQTVVESGPPGGGGEPAGPSIFQE